MDDDKYEDVKLSTLLKMALMRLNELDALAVDEECILKLSKDKKSLIPKYQTNKTRRIANELEKKIRSINSDDKKGNFLYFDAFDLYCYHEYEADIEKAFSDLSRKNVINKQDFRQ